MLVPPGAMQQRRRGVAAPAATTICVSGTADDLYRITRGTSFGDLCRAAEEHAGVARGTLRCLVAADSELVWGYAAAHRFAFKFVEHSDDPYDYLGTSPCARFEPPRLSEEAAREGARAVGFDAGAASLATAAALEEAARADAAVTGLVTQLRALQSEAGPPDPADEMGMLHALTTALSRHEAACTRAAQLAQVRDACRAASYRPPTPEHAGGDAGFAY